MSTALARLADLKTRLGTTSTAQDALLSELLAEATAVAEQLVGGRRLLRQVGRTDYPEVARPYDRPRLWLDLAPIETITSVKQIYNPTDGFDDAEALVAGSDYWMTDADALVGALNKLPLNSAWWLAPGCVQVIYTGGYADMLDLDAGEAPAEGVAPPVDLQAAVIAEAIAAYNRRSTGGVDAASLGSAGSVQITRAEPNPQLVAACAPLRRYMDL